MGKSYKQNDKHEKYRKPKQEKWRKKNRHNNFQHDSNKDSDSENLEIIPEDYET